jgi:serine/threonine-protein kinase
MNLPRNTLIGEYRITESLGAGGMGEVYRAVHTHLDRVIAIKVLSPELADGAALRRFYAEAAIQASLRHPGVAEYLGFYEYQGRPCILMEYVDGETLAAMLQRRGPLPAYEALSLLREIAEVAAHFHQSGVVHRDLKSSNVKLTTRGRVKILDFGIAQHQRSTRLTQAGAVIGTPEILSPEQLRGEPAGQATDVWQLGVLFYELLTAEMPFTGSNTAQVYTSILHGSCRPVHDWQPDLPPAIPRILARCLEKEPGRRYASALELCDALAEASKPESRPAHRLAAVLAALATVLVLVIGFLLLRGRPAIPDAPPPRTDASAVLETKWKTVTVDTADGPADVIRDGQRIGSTPFPVQAREGESVQLVLRRQGFRDLPVEFQPSERRNYTYTLEAQPQQPPQTARKEQ